MNTSKVTDFILELYIWAQMALNKDCLEYAEDIEEAFEAQEFLKSLERRKK